MTDQILLPVGNINVAYLQEFDLQITTWITNTKISWMFRNSVVSSWQYPATFSFCGTRCSSLLGPPATTHQHKHILHTASKDRSCCYCYFYFSHKYQILSLLIKAKIPLCSLHERSLSWLYSRFVCAVIDWESNFWLHLYFTFHVTLKQLHQGAIS